MKIDEIGIIGFGAMGRGIAEAALAAGYHIKVLGRDDASCKKHIVDFSNTLQRSARLERFPKDVAKSLSERLAPCANLEELKHCNLIIESIPENLLAKQELFRQLDSIVESETVLVTNTSCLTVNQIAILASRKDRILGIHFFNPVSFMKLVEVIKTQYTSQQALEKAYKFCKSLGKTVVAAPDTPGFIVNRLLLAFLAEAMRLHELGVSADDIDKAVTLGLNHPMGPFKLADFIGLDTALSIATSMKEQLNSPHFSPSATIERLVEKGKLGRKSGEGFYRY